MSSKRPKCKRRKDCFLALSCLSLASSFGDSDALESITSSHVPLTTPSSMAAAAAALPKVLASGRRRKRIRNSSSSSSSNIHKSIQETTISLQGGEIARGGSDEMDTNSFLTNFQDQVSDMRKQLEDETFAKLRRLKEELRAQKIKADGSETNASGKQQQQQRNKRNSIPKSSPHAGQRQQGYAEEVEDYSDGNNGNNNYNNNQDWSDYDEQNSMANHDYYNNGGDTDSDYNENIMRQPTWNEADHQAPKIIVGGGAIGVQPPGFRKTPKKQQYGGHAQQQHYPTQGDPYGGNQYGAGAQHKRGSAQLPRHRGNHPPPGSHRNRPNNNDINDGVIMNPYQQQQHQQQFGYPQQAVSDKWRTATMGLLVIVLCVLASMIWNVVMGNG